VGALLGHLIHFVFVVHGALPEFSLVGEIGGGGHETSHFGIDPILQLIAIVVGNSHQRHHHEKGKAPPHARKDAAVAGRFCGKPKRRKKLKKKEKDWKE